MVDFAMLETEENRGRHNRKKWFLPFFSFHCKICDTIVQLLQLKEYITLSDFDGGKNKKKIFFLADFYFLMNANEEVNISADLMSHAIHANSLQTQDIIPFFKGASRIR